jgi:hypothetical protein
MAEIRAGKEGSMGAQELRDQAKEAVLEKITELSRSGINPALLLHLAEAYAWLEAPNQPHGGQTGRT